MMIAYPLTKAFIHNVVNLLKITYYFCLSVCLSVYVCFSFKFDVKSMLFYFQNYYGKKSKRFVILSSNQSSERHLFYFFALIKPTGWKRIYQVNYLIRIRLEIASQEKWAKLAKHVNIFYIYTLISD